MRTGCGSGGPISESARGPICAAPMTGAGGNESADASHFLYQLADDFNVALDVQGPGVLYFVRYNHWHGSPWHYEVDGTDHMVRETSTADPLHPAPNSVFLPERALPCPAGVDMGRHQGRGPRLGSHRVREILSHGLLAHALRHRLLHLSAVRPGASSRSPSGAWDGQTPPDPDVLKLIAPRRHRSRSRARHARASASDRDDWIVPARESVPLWNAARPPPCCGRWNSRFRSTRPWRFRRCALRVTWDGRAQPSIDAPSRSSTVRARSITATVASTWSRLSHVSALWPTDGSTWPATSPCRSSVRRASSWSAPRRSVTSPTPLGDAHRPLPRPCEPGRLLPRHVSRPSHARTGKDLVLLDTNEAEGGGDWSGQLRREPPLSSRTPRSQHPGRRPAILLRRQPDPAGARAPAPKSGAAAATIGAAET